MSKVMDPETNQVKPDCIPVKSVGDRFEVWAGVARKTASGLTKDDLIESKGAIKSKKASEAGKKRAPPTFKAKELIEVEHTPQVAPSVAKAVEFVKPVSKPTAESKPAPKPVVQDIPEELDHLSKSEKKRYLKHKAKFAESDKAFKDKLHSGDDDDSGTEATATRVKPKTRKPSSSVNKTK